MLSSTSADPLTEKICRRLGRVAKLTGWVLVVLPWSVLSSMVWVSRGGGEEEMMVVMVAVVVVVVAVANTKTQTTNNN